MMRGFLPVDTVVVCAGQVSVNSLYQPLLDLGIEVHLIGGAEKAGELDAKRAIEQGLMLAEKITTSNQEKQKLAS